ncbi:MAG: alpha/beta hydrolase [Rhodocyclaceae bacterium]|nr:alpha/beta hydrolase [Rhodocyclaceae bacterium]
MRRDDLPQLEILSRLPEGRAASDVPLLFVHGAYAGAWCWDEHFLPYFAAHGFASHAVSLRGHGGSPDRHLLDSYSIDNYVEDVSRAVATLDAPPILIGHSMGGFVVQKFLERGEAVGAVLLSSVPPQGLMASAFGLAMRKPGLMSEFNKLLGGGRVDGDALREALFHQPVDDADLKRYLRASQSESHRALWDMSLFNLPRVASVAAVPLLVIGTQYDELIPSGQVEMTARTYGVDAHILPDLGHGMMLERGWQRVAELVLGWLRAQDL